MKRSGLTEFEIEEEGFKLRICRKNGESQTWVTTPTAPPFPVQSMPAAPVPESAGEQKKPKVEGKVIKSPMVGTFYTAPSPESPPFIKAGDTVNPETTVCIVEAMKVMNEIKAEMSGSIAEILVENGESVEYGQPLFVLK